MRSDSVDLETGAIKTGVCHSLQSRER